MPASPTAAVAARTRAPAHPLDRGRRCLPGRLEQRTAESAESPSDRDESGQDRKHRARLEAAQRSHDAYVCNAHRTLQSGALLIAIRPCSYRLVEQVAGAGMDAGALLLGTRHADDRTAAFPIRRRGASGLTRSPLVNGTWATIGITTAAAAVVTAAIDPRGRHGQG